MSDPILRLHREAFVFDGHNDLALRLFAGERIERRTNRGHMDLPRMRDGGFDGGVFAVWIDPRTPAAAEAALQGVERLRGYLTGTEGFRPVLTGADLAEAERVGEVAAVIGVEGGYPITEDLSMVDRLAEAGMRCLTLTWMTPTAWADAAGGEPVHGGLTAFGGRVVERLQKLGVAIDLSHASDAVVKQVLGRVDVPVLVSHSGVRAVADHPRNLPDALLERLAANSGVLGINFFSAYLDEAFGAGFERLKQRFPDGTFSGPELDRAVQRELEPIPLRKVAEHLEHAVAVAGVRHVGLGSDFDGVAALPVGLEDVAALPNLTLELARRGMADDALRLVLGANLRRVFQAVLP